MRATRLVLLCTVLALTVVAPAAAQDPYDDFRDDGQINTCQYSDEQLRQGLDGLPPDVIQYSPGLADQLAAGREGCGGGAPGSSTDTRDLELVPGPAAGLGGRGGGPGEGAVKARIPDPPAPTASDRERLADVATPDVAATSRADVPGWAIALLAAAGAVALLLALARPLGLGAGSPLRASFAEAGGRTADAAAQVWDSVRLGR